MRVDRRTSLISWGSPLCMSFFANSAIRGEFWWDRTYRATNRTGGTGYAKQPLWPLGKAIHLIPDFYYFHIRRLNITPLVNAWTY